MKVSDLVQSRMQNWRELDSLCAAMEGRSKRMIPAWTVGRFSSLYRAACADLALADAHQLPPGTVDYLHRLVARAHNQLYRSRTFKTREWFHQLFVVVPQTLFSDNYLRLSAFIFFGVFMLSAGLAYNSEDFAQKVVGEEALVGYQTSFSQPVSERSGGLRVAFAGGYIFINVSIGLRCFALGLLFGIAGLYITLFNAAMLGAVFGYMATVPESENFFEFVTAHAPFELTAIVLSAAAGMRLGFALVSTGGLTRLASLRKQAKLAMPIMSAAMLLFFLAAFIEAGLSPTAVPYTVKAGVAVLSSAILMYYFVILGMPRSEEIPAEG